MSAARRLNRSAGGDGSQPPRFDRRRVGHTALLSVLGQRDAAPWSLHFWHQHEAGAARSARGLGVKAGEVTAAWVETADRKSACELYRVICAQRVARCLSCARDEHRLAQGNDRKREPESRSPWKSNSNALTKSVGGYILQLACSRLAPQRGGHLHTRERRDDERVECADRSMPILVGIELHERRRIGKGTQLRPSARKSDSGLPRPAAARARLSARSDGRRVARRSGFSRSPARPRRSLKPVISSPARSGSTAAERTLTA